MSQSREWTDGVIDVADELVQEHSAEGAIERLERREESTRSDDLEARCNEAIDWIEAQVIDE